MKAIDRSDVIALIALTISLVGTVVAVRETTILQQQQEVMLSQKAASVLPYVEKSISLHQEDDTTFTLVISVENTGVGPAIVADNHFTFDSAAVRVDSLKTVISAAFPDIKIVQKQSRTLESGILSAQKHYDLITLEFKLDYQPMPFFERLLNRIEIVNNYCNIYGDCWTLMSEGWNKRCEECEPPLHL